MPTTITFWPHYEIFSNVKTMAQIKNFFPEGKADELNWFFASTSGVHGSYTTLDDVVACWDMDPEDEEYIGRHITVLIVHPRLVVMRYGNVTLETRLVVW